MEERDNTVVLVDENGEEVEFEHLDTFEMNDNTYVVLFPIEDEENEDDEVVIFKLDKDEKGEEILSIIDDEEELFEAFDEFKLRIDDEDLEEFEEFDDYEDFEEDNGFEE